MDDDLDPRQATALARYQVISAFLAMEPRRGQRRQLLEQLAARTWTGADGEPLTVSAETLRVWVRRYRRQGLAGLQDKARQRPGVGAVSAEQAKILCGLKREVPERSLDRILAIAEGTGLIPTGIVRRSTLHRVLKSAGISARKARIPDAQDLDRFEADFPNDLWQSDMLKGPWLPDPERPGKVRQAHLFAFLDDHSRLVLHGRFGFRENLPSLELVFRRALQKHAVPRRVYYDNGQVYRSGHMRQIVATLGIHRVIFTRAYRPMGHGKIEALNRLIRSAFLAELKASHITTLDALNEAFVAWVDLDYQRHVHTETGEAPLDRWRKGLDRVRYADDEALRQAFRWRELRTADKTGVFSLFGCRYQTGPDLARRKVEVRFDPEALHEVEVWHGGRFAERVRPLDVQAHRRPRPSGGEDATPVAPPTTPVADWLGHLVERRRREGFLEPPPRQLSEDAAVRRAVLDQAIVDTLAARLDPAVFDEPVIREFLARFGPLDLERTGLVLDRLLSDGGRNDHHVSLYLEAIRTDGGDR